jgi:hypothetical protein
MWTCGIILQAFVEVAMLLGPTVVHDILCVFYSWFLATNRPTCNFFLAPPL